MQGFERTVLRISLNIVGDYIYYDDPVDAHNFEKNVLYHFDFIGDDSSLINFAK